MELEYDSRKNCASQMKRTHNFFFAAYFAIPLPTVNCQLSIVNCPLDSHLRSSLLHQEDTCDDNDNSKNLI